MAPLLATFQMLALPIETQVRDTVAMMEEIQVMAEAKETAGEDTQVSVEAEGILLVEAGITEVEEGEVVEPEDIVVPVMVTAVAEDIAVVAEDIVVPVMVIAVAEDIAVVAEDMVVPVMVTAVADSDSCNVG